MKITPIAYQSTYNTLNDNKWLCIYMVHLKNLFSSIFVGGVGESYKLCKFPATEIFKMMLKAFERGSFISTGIAGSDEFITPGNDIVSLCEYLKLNPLFWQVYITLFRGEMELMPFRVCNP